MFVKRKIVTRSLQTRNIGRFTLKKFCGPFKILKKVGEVAYKLELLAHSKVHPVFHVSPLRKRLIGMERPVVEYVEPPILPHEPERVLDYHMLRTRHQVQK